MNGHDWSTWWPCLAVGFTGAALAVALGLAVLLVTGC